jgi:hypothetical protein
MTQDGYPAFRLCNTWFDSQVTVKEAGGIEPLIMGLASQIAEKEDAIIIDDLRGQSLLNYLISFKEFILFGGMILVAFFCEI